MDEKDHEEMKKSDRHCALRKAFDKVVNARGARRAKYREEYEKLNRHSHFWVDMENISFMKKIANELNREISKQKETIRVQAEEIKNMSKLRETIRIQEETIKELRSKVPSSSDIITKMQEEFQKMREFITQTSRGPSSPQVDVTE